MISLSTKYRKQPKIVLVDSSHIYWVRKYKTWSDKYPDLFISSDFYFYGMQKNFHPFSIVTSHVQVS